VDWFFKPVWDVMRSRCWRTVSCRLVARTHL